MKDFQLQFGGKITPELKQQYEESENWRENKFQNLETTELDIGLCKIPAVIYKQLSNSPNKEPKSPIPVIPFEKSSFVSQSAKSKFIWYGHSALLMRMDEKTLLIDPMLGPNTTPIAPVANKRFSENTLSLIDDFPEIDLVLITHDHYDHLDFASIQKLKSKVKQYYVALGVKRHLVKWGVKPELIFEFDWWDRRQFDQIGITFTPTRHFSGRGLTDRTKSLWGGWVFKSSNESIWFSGDGGYGKHFLDIGEKLGPFDFAFMECGQYNEDWRPIHMFPEESIKAAIEAKVKKAMPVHWAGFSLSYQHEWNEPAIEFTRYAKKNKLEVLTPKIGEEFSVDSSISDHWWLSPNLDGLKK